MRTSPRWTASLLAIGLLAAPALAAPGTVQPQPTAQASQRGRKKPPVIHPGTVPRGRTATGTRRPASGWQPIFVR